MGQSNSIPTNLPEIAFHCLRVADSSPTDGLIEPYFDYLIGISSKTKQNSNDLFNLINNEIGYKKEIGLSKIIEENENNLIELKVYNAKSQKIRANDEINTLSNTNNNTNNKPKPSLLGLSLRICNPANALESVYHVLDVLEGSPAEMAGLVPWGDYVLAWSGGPLHSENDFYNLIEAHVDKPLRLFVYNSDLDNLREVILYPTRQWGGEGLIGCGIGYGLLHRIPRPSTPPNEPVDGYFNQDQNRISDSSRQNEVIAS
uniref:PDZ GRASP-type domain-containing protein n=1 Tax=Kwoniella pini CBS 10737 TaxID=1296096 RepID=A0A1B9HY21_9TREE|nr:uncharacterized protein I206_06044 [Kwoniella pini CBS 10737]OCF48176.1 hypothetical protein I206_06044 [Kwoniella pini CBS 10737]